MPTHQYFLPDFVEIQRESFLNFLKKGIVEEFTKRNPITNKNKNIEIFFYSDYFCLTKPEYSIQQAIFFKKSYVSKLYIPIQYTDKTKKLIYLKWILIAQLPLMTKRGHFVLNGAARVIINQLVRSPGVYFRENFYEIYYNKWASKPSRVLKRFYADIICLKGTWVRIEIQKDFSMWVRLKKGPKIPLLWFLLGMGLNEKMIFQSVISPNFLLNSFTVSGGGPVIKQSLKEQSISGHSIKQGRKTKTTTKISANSFKYPYVSTTPEAWKQIAQLFNLKKNRRNSKSNRDRVSSKKTSNPFNTSSLRSISGRITNRKGVNPNQNQLALNNFFEASTTYVDRFRRNRAQALHIEAGGQTNPLNSITGHFPSSNLIINNNQSLALGYATSSELNKSFDPNQSENLHKQSFSWGPTRASTNSDGSVYKSNPYANISSGKSDKKIKESLNLADLGRKWFFQRFMNPRTYDLGKKGRLAFNQKLGLTILPNQTTLTAQDLLFITDYLMKVEKGIYPVDDIDHLKNKRIRSAGELIQMQFGIGLMRLEKTIRLKLSPTRGMATKQKKNPIYSKLQNHSGLSYQTSPLLLSGTIDKGNRNINLLASNPIKGKDLLGIGDPLHQAQKFKAGGMTNNKSFLWLNSLIQPKVVNGALKEFFGTHPLSQFMDQINPLAEITHKRRLTSLGPGGVSRDSATLAIRGIHPSHYGRICPIETPEGKNTGLVNSLTVYARVNQEGFILSPFYSLYKAQVQKSLGKIYLSAAQEENFQIATPDLNITNKNFLPKQKIPVRSGKNFFNGSAENLSFMGISPLQMISVATSLIPFLEHDDANRALMGSNMQRQAVPLIQPERPFIGTGLEAKAISDSGYALTTSKSGFVLYASGSLIILYTNETF